MAPPLRLYTPCVAPGPDEDLVPEAEAIGDDELAALALADDPFTTVAPDAVPIDVYLGTEPNPLPEWYMPRVTSRRATGRRRIVVGSLVGAFVLIEAFGLCSTYGQLPFH